MLPLNKEKEMTYISLVFSDTSCDHVNAEEPGYILFFSPFDRWERKLRHSEAKWLAWSQ